MGVNYGNRGGDIVDLNQLNAYIFNLEQSANVNFYMNTHHFNPNSAQDNLAFVGYFSKDRLCLASVYVLLDSDTDPSVYPEPPTIKNIATNAIVTATKIADNKQVFYFKKFAIEYKMVILRTSYSLSESNFYMKCSFNAINTIKDITSTNYKLNQFLCWQELTTKVDYARLSESNVGVYTDFVFANKAHKSAFAATLINSSNNPLYSENGAFTNLFTTEFFNLGNFSKEYLKGLRFIFKRNDDNTLYKIAYNKWFSDNYQVVNEINTFMEVVNDYTDFSIVKISNIESFISAIETIYRRGTCIFKPTIIRRNPYTSESVIDVCLGIVCENTFFEYPNISATDTLNAATLFCTKQNANSTHNAANFHGEIGLDISQNNQVGQELYMNSSYLYPFWLIFKNNFFQTSNEFSFDYELGSGHVLKAGFTTELTTI